MSFFKRVLSYVANEILVERLANARWFQRFAIRTDAAAKEMFGKGKEALGGNAAADPAKQLAEAQKELEGFVRSFRDELGKQAGYKGPPPK